jgi:trk system potassium uptake protein TrkH
MMHPNAVIAVRIDKEAISDDLVSRSVLYVAIYILFVFISTLLLSIFNVNLLEAFSGTVAAMGNVGPGLGEVGSVGNYANLPGIAKWILSLMMLLGRLEIFAFLIIFTRSQWSKQVTY